MSGATKSPGTGAFAIEKVVVFGAVILGAGFSAIHATGWVLAAVTGNPPPAFSIPHVLAAIRLRPYVPGVAPGFHAVLLLLLVVAAAWSARRVLRWRSSRAAAPSHRATGFDTRPGWATPEAVRRVASTRALMAQAVTLRPRLAKPRPVDVGYLLGASRGQEVWASVERSILVVGPPGSGKGLHLAINAILDAPGSVITTSTKPDNIKATLLARAARGPVGVFDPQGMLGAHFAHQVAWDPIDGCEDPIRAATRAEALAANTGITSNGENAVWRGHAKTIIECVLHAAALNGADIDTAYRWMQSPHAMDLPLVILENHSQACPTWDSRLRGLIQNPDPRFVGSVMSVVASAITPLSLPTVRAALTPTATRPGITAGDLLRDSGTLYALATDRGAGASAGLVSALIEDIAYVARVTAARSPGGRMDPPVLFLLDECANVAPIPSLPNLLADGRGQSLTIIPIFQTLAQVRSRYGDEDASTVFSASQIKLILGGSDDADDCRDISNLIGERDDWYATTSHSTHALAIDTNATTSSSLRKVPILPPDAIRAIPFGSAVMLQSQTEPFPLRLRPWTTRPDAPHLASQSQAIEDAILDAASSAPSDPGVAL
ncbi:MAG: type IV secretory system conjugative DNA transfer family protein [Actinobacteria bacterium]|nr:type IV secretory system conjugative DNA transfer family protein [Actinomycetota bacterium]